MQKLQAFASLGVRRLLIDGSTSHIEELNVTGYGFDTSSMAESFRHLLYGQCLEEELCFLGTPEQVIAQIRRLD